MKTPSDEELMQRVRDGDPEAFEQIVLRYQNEAWRVILYKMLVNGLTLEFLRGIEGRL